MNSYDFELSEKEVAGSTAIMRLGRKLASAFARKARAENLTKAMIAERLDVDKAVVSRMLAGNANLTFRSFGELCWAMGIRPEISLVDDDLAVPHPNVAPTFQVVTANRASSLTGKKLRVIAQ